MACSKISVILLCSAFFTLALGEEVCTSPTVSTNTYTSKSMTLSTQTAFVAEFTVTCREKTSAFNLHAEVERGVLVPVATVGEADTNEYQLSWLQEHKMAVIGSIPMKMFTDDGLAEYRKVQRNGGDVSEVQPLFAITIEHPGVVRESWFVQTEFIAVLCCLLVLWSANSMRSQIVA